MSSKLLVLALSLGLTVGVINASAEEAKEGKEGKKEEIKETVQTGTLASQVNAGLSQSVDVNTGAAAPGDTGGVLAANVSVLDKSTCLVRLINNGKKSYSVSYELIGKDSGGIKKFSRYFTSTVGPGKSVEQRSSACNGGGMNLFVVVHTAKPL